MNADAYPLSVAHLAMRQATAMALQAPPKLPRWMFVVLRPFSKWIARHCLEQAEKLATVSVWFQGAVSAVAQDVSGQPIDADGTLVPSMESMEGVLLDLRRNMLDALNSVEKVRGLGNGPTRDALRLIAMASADAFEAVQTFRWAVMEHDAEIDIASGHTSKAFTSAEDLIASLKS